MNFKKIISSGLIILLCFSNTSSFVVYAQEEVVSGSVDIENTAEVIDDIESTSNTGENEIIVESPTPTPSSTPIETLLSEPIEEVLPSPTPDSEIVTGDSVSVVEVENNVNTNIVNSVILNHTLNIFLSEEIGDLDLSLLAENAVNKVFEEDKNTGEEVSVNVLGINNFAYVENNIDTSSNTGGNSVEGEGLSEINTGNAYSVVTVLNNVNTNVVDSTFHLVTINIFGVMEGNIILPEFEEPDQSCEDCSEDLDIENLATVVNNVDSSANTGQNSITSATDSTQVVTGDAQSVVNVYNLVNTNWINTVFKSLRVNTYGNWQGDFLGWGDFVETVDNNMSLLSSSQGVGDQSCESCFDEINVQNQAEIVNNINSSSNTGGNSLSADGGEITTGNAYSSVSLFNIINSNIINSTGFVGFINIFGTLTGNIGGANEFIEPEILEEELVEEVLQGEQNEDDGQKQVGGELVLEADHNVGAYVLPGDTITFTAKVKNPGHGILYDTKVFIELFKDGESFGGSFFNLGEIEPFKSLTLSTGLVLSEDAEAGDYDAVVTATGVVGPDTHLSDFMTLPFKIIGFTPAVIDDSFVAGVSASDGLIPPSVLGTNTGGLSTVEKRLITIFSALLLTYLMGRGYQRREQYVFPVARKMSDYALRIGSLLT